MACSCLPPSMKHSRASDPSPIVVACIVQCRFPMIRFLCQPLAARISRMRLTAFPLWPRRLIPNRAINALLCRMLFLTLFVSPFMYAARRQRAATAFEELSLRRTSSSRARATMWDGVYSRKPRPSCFGLTLIKVVESILDVHMVYVLL